MNAAETDISIFFNLLDLLETDEQFDAIIVTDDLEPGQSPFEAIKQIKKKFSETTVIFLGLDEKTVKRAQFYGADSAFTLPLFQFTPGEFVKRAIARFKQKQMAQKPYLKEEQPEKRSD